MTLPLVTELLSIKQVSCIREPPVYAKPVSSNRLARVARNPLDAKP
jgi:hypothetical protein